MARKFFSVFLFLTLFVFHAFAQSANKPLNEDNLYIKSLKACLEKQAKDYADITAAADLYNITVEKDYKLTDRFPNRIGAFNLTYLDSDELAQKFKGLPQNKSKGNVTLPVLRIFPLDNEGSVLKFAFSNYHLSYSEKGDLFSRKKFLFNYALEGGCRVDIAYDNTEQNFVIKKVELWGV